MPHLACLGIPYPKKQTDFFDGVQRSSVYDAVFEQDQVENLGPFSSGGTNLRMRDRSFKNWVSGVGGLGDGQLRR